MSRDAEHLKLLTIFHYVLAGLVALGASIPILHVAIGIWVLTAPPAPAPGRPPPSFIGWFFVIFGAAAVLLGWAFAACLAVAGRNLSRRRGWTFCLVVACLSCLWVPMGTALGVCTLLVLLRPTVKGLFAGRLVEPPHPEDEDSWPPHARPAYADEDERFYRPR
jgi:hypothetical protein